MNRVLITGGTGVIGSALAPLYLNDPDWQVCLLLRAESEAHLRQRVQALFAFWGDDIADPAAPARLQALRGDVSLPRFGLAEADYERLCGSLTHIVHGAASVKMNMTAEQARRSSVVPVREALDLAEACRRRGQFRKLDYISTLGVAGGQPGLVPEAPLVEPRPFHNTYESSKAEAEELVLARMAEGLPATIHRPSMVVGDSRSGKIVSFQVFYYLCDFLSGRHTSGFVPRLRDKQLDTVPADYVAAAIHWSNGSSESTGRILHLCSGPESAISILDLVRQVRAAKVAQGARLPALRLVSVPLFKTVFRLLKALSRGRRHKQLSNLGLFLDYMEESQSFDNRRSRASLSQAGIALPTPESYLRQLFGYQAAAEKPTPTATPAAAAGDDARSASPAARWLHDTTGPALPAAEAPAPGSANALPPRR